MSNSTPRPASPIHPTQHQLDELEALMQRMLALPVNQLEEPGSVAALSSPVPLPEWESAALVEIQDIQEIQNRIGAEPEEAEFLSAVKRLEPPDETDVVALAERLFPAAAEQPTAKHENKVPEPAEPVPAAERMLPVMRTPIVVRPPEIENNSQTTAANKLGKPRVVPAGRRLARDRPGWGMRTLLWSNRVFDRQVGRWGALGRWLRGPYGRTLLGLAGLLLLLAALAFGALDWIGWTW